MDNNRIFIYGAGRIGIFLGGCFMSSGLNVTFIGRERLLKEIKDNKKLIISDFRGGECEFSYTGNKETDSFNYITSLNSNDINEGDYIIITVKREQSKEVADNLKELNIPVKYHIISFQNGVGNKEIFEETLPKLTITSAIFGANVIKYDNEPHFRLATTNPAIIEHINDRTQFISDYLNKGKANKRLYVDCELYSSKDMNKMIYGKLLLNLNNAVNALCGLPLQEELGERNCRKVLANCVSEAITVMEANKITPGALHPLMQPKILPHIMKLPTFIYLRLASSSLQIDKDAKSSMWDDLSSGRKTEIDYLNGVIIDLGKKANIPTPVNQVIYDLIKKAEKQGKSPCYSPDTLLKYTKKPQLINADDM